MKKIVKLICGVMFLAIGLGIWCFYYDQHDALNHALAKMHELGLISGPVKIELLVGCSRSKVYKVISVNGAYVVKTMDGYKNSDRQHQITLQKIVSDSKSGPFLHVDDVNRGYIIMEYISPLEGASKENTLHDKILLYMQLLKAFHALPCEGLKQVNFMERLKLRVWESKKACIKNGVDYQRILQILTVIEKESAYKGLQGLCHTDLNPNNVIFDGKNMRLIDFEDAGCGDIFIDLGVAISYAMMDHELGRYIFTQQDEQFALDCYFKRPLSTQELRHLHAMVMAGCLFYGSTYIKRTDKNSLDEAKAFFSIAQHMYDQLQDQ